MAVAGNFNDWSPGASRMVARGEGRWTKDMTLPPGRYEYCFVADRNWICDPAAQERVPNPYGGFNAVLQVGGNACA